MIELHDMMDVRHFVVIISRVYRSSERLHSLMWLHRFDVISLSIMSDNYIALMASRATVH